MNGGSPSHAHPGRTRQMVVAALLASLLCISAYLVIPLQPVPVTLQILVVALAGLLLTPGWAATAVAVYLVLGAVGVPVFSGGQGGLGVLAGPTGGYLTGFLAAAFVSAWVRGVMLRFGRSDIVADIVAACFVVPVAYLPGVVQLSVVTGMGAGKALLAGAVPFLLPDAVKVVVAIGVAQAVRRATRG